MLHTSLPSPLVIAHHTAGCATFYWAYIPFGASAQDLEKNSPNIAAIRESWNAQESKALFKLHSKAKLRIQTNVLRSQTYNRQTTVLEHLGRSRGFAQRSSLSAQWTLEVKQEHWGSLSEGWVICGWMNLDGVQGVRWGSLPYWVSVDHSNFSSDLICVNPRLISCQSQGSCCRARPGVTLRSPCLRWGGPSHWSLVWTLWSLPALAGRGGERVPVWSKGFWAQSSGGSAGSE